MGSAVCCGVPTTERCTCSAGIFKDLSTQFPELVCAGEALPPETLIDGEIVIADTDGNSDLGALQARLGVGRRDAGKSAQQKPAVLLAFDVLRHAGVDLVGSHGAIDG
jgi:ATP-dependent DNA ligase